MKEGRRASSNPKPMLFSRACLGTGLETVSYSGPKLCQGTCSVMGSMDDQWYSADRHSLPFSLANTNKHESCMTSWSQH